MPGVNRVKEPSAQVLFEIYFFRKICRMFSHLKPFKITPLVTYHHLALSDENHPRWILASVSFEKRVRYFLNLTIVVLSVCGPACGLLVFMPIIRAFRMFCHQVKDKIGHFRVASSLFLKTRLSAVFDMKIIFISHANKTYFHMKGFALGLVLKVRVFGTRNWPIVYQSGTEFELCFPVLSWAHGVSSTINW